MDRNARVPVYDTRPAIGAASHARYSRNRLALAERYGLSVYHGMTAASALQTDCDILWSQDMQDGVVIHNRLRIVNPFRPP
jgi:predicted nucleic acid-binding protein